jgi:hypothetical protein
MNPYSKENLKRAKELLKQASFEAIQAIESLNSDDPFLESLRHTEIIGKNRPSVIASIKAKQNKPL